MTHRIRFFVPMKLEITFFTVLSLTALLGCSSFLGPEKKGVPVVETGKKRIEARVYFKQGIDHMDRGAFDRAISSFQNALSLDPELSSAHNNLGVLFKQKGLMQQAKEYYLKAISVSGDFPEVHNNLGILLREQGHFLEAEREYRIAVQIDPDFSPAYYNLGILYDLYLNQPEEAIKAFSVYSTKGGRPQPEIESWILNLERRLDGISHPRLER